MLVKQGEILLIGPNDISSDELGQTINSVNANYRPKIDHFYDTTAPDAEHDNGPGNGHRIFFRSDH